MASSSEQLKSDLSAFVRDHGRLPRETPTLPAEEKQLARRCRRARAAGNLTADDLNVLLSQPSIMQEVREFVSEHGRLPRENTTESPDERSLGKRTRRAVGDGKIDPEELQLFGRGQDNHARGT